MPKIRIRYNVDEIVNNWEMDSPDFDVKQEEIFVELKKLPCLGDIVKTPDGKQRLVIEKIVISNNQNRPDKLDAFAQAKLV